MYTVFIGGNARRGELRKKKFFGRHRAMKRKLFAILAAAALAAVMVLACGCKIVIRDLSGVAGKGERVSEEEWKTILDRETVVTDEGIELWGQTNYKMEITESMKFSYFGDIDLACTVISDGENAHVIMPPFSVAGILLWEEAYIHVNEDKSLEIYTYDEYAADWTKETTTLEATTYNVFFQPPVANSTGEGFILMSEVLPYDSFTFDAATGVYEGKIDETIKRTVAGTEMEYHFTGEVALSFSDGKILSMEYNVTTTQTGDGILDGESFSSFRQFTAGGQSVSLPDKNTKPAA